MISHSLLWITKMLKLILDTSVAKIDVDAEQMTKFSFFVSCLRLPP